MTAQYFVLQADAKNKKTRTTVDHHPGKFGYVIRRAAIEYIPSDFDLLDLRLNPDCISNT